MIESLYTAGYDYAIYKSPPLKNSRFVGIDKPVKSVLPINGRLIFLGISGSPPYFLKDQPYPIDSKIAISRIRLVLFMLSRNRSLC